MVEQTRIVRDCHSFVDSCNSINKAIAHTPEVEIQCTYKTKIIPFWTLCYESEAILSKMFHPGHQAVTDEPLGRKNGDVGNRASPASH